MGICKGTAPNLQPVNGDFSCPQYPVNGDLKSKKSPVNGEESKYLNFIACKRGG